MRPPGAAAPAPTSRARGAPRRGRRRGYRWPPRRRSRPPSPGRARRSKTRRTSKSSTTPAPSTSLEREQLDRDRAGLPEEDGRPVEAGEAQTVAGAVLGLDRERPRHREQRGQQHRHPEQARRDALEDAAVGVEGEGEEQEDDQPERQDLLGGDPRPGLDAQVLARDERGLLEQVHVRTACAVSPAGRARVARSAPPRCRAGRASASRAQQLPWAWPAVSTTSRPARARARSSSCDASSTVRPSAAAPREDAVEHLAALGVEPGVGLVEQQEARLARDARPRGRAGGADRRRGGRGCTSASRASPSCSSAASAAAAREPDGPRGEPEVLAHGQVVVAERLVADERQLTAHGRAGRRPGRARAPRPRPSAAGASPASRRSSVVLPGAVAAREQDDLALGDVEIHPGERGEATEQAHGGAETDDEGHSASGTVDAPECTNPARTAGEPGDEASTAASPAARSAGPAARNIARCAGSSRQPGKVLITVGILVLLFVVYQLWGTGIYEAQAQGDLQSQFSADLRRNGDADDHDPAGTTSTTVARRHDDHDHDAPAPAPPVPFGDAVAHLVIPKIGVDKYVVQGVGVPDLRKGPGHYPHTPMPGQVGQRRDRRPPHHLRRAVLEPRPTSPSATRSRSRRCRAPSPTRSRRTRSPSIPTTSASSTPCTRTTTPRRRPRRGSRSRPATRGSRRRSG